MRHGACVDEGLEFVSSQRVLCVAICMTSLKAIYDVTTVNVAYELTLHGFTTECL